MASRPHTRSLPCGLFLRSAGCGPTESSDSSCGGIAGSRGSLIAAPAVDGPRLFSPSRAGRVSTPESGQSVGDHGQGCELRLEHPFRARAAPCIPGASGKHPGLQDAGTEVAFICSALGATLPGRSHRQGEPEVAGGVPRNRTIERRDHRSGGVITGSALIVNAVCTPGRAARALSPDPDPGEDDAAATLGMRLDGHRRDAHLIERWSALCVPGASHRRSASKTWPKTSGELGSSSCKGARPNRPGPPSSGEDGPQGRPFGNAITNFPTRGPAYGMDHGPLPRGGSLDHSPACGANRFPATRARRLPCGGQGVARQDPFDPLIRRARLRVPSPPCRRP